MIMRDYPTLNLDIKLSKDTAVLHFTFTVGSSTMTLTHSLIWVVWMLFNNDLNSFSNMSGLNAL
jgi:hypothetical protein